jgi:hypothetical protein
MAITMGKTGLVITQPHDQRVPIWPKGGSASLSGHPLPYGPEKGALAM